MQENNMMCNLFTSCLMLFCFGQLWEGERELLQNNGVLCFMTVGVLDIIVLVFRRTIVAFRWGVGLNCSTKLI